MKKWEANLVGGVMLLVIAIMVLLWSYIPFREIQSLKEMEAHGILAIIGAIMLGSGIAICFDTITIYMLEKLIASKTRDLK